MCVLGWEIPCFFACGRRKRGRPYPFLYRCPAGYLLPYAKPSNKGLFQVKDFWKYGHFRQQTLITPQGKDLLRMMLCGGQMSMEFDFC